MAWLARNALRGDQGPAESSAWGFLPLAGGLALAAIDANAQSRYSPRSGSLMALPGLSLLLLGARRTCALRVPLLIGILLVPIPYTVGTPLVLRTLTANGVLPLLHLLGFTAVREGTQLILPRQNFLVADACSGVATLYASVASAMVLAALSTSHWRRAALLLSAPLLAVAANVVRVTLLVLLAHAFGTELLDTAMHEASGVATFGIVLVILLRDREHPNARSQGDGMRSSSRFLIPIVGLALGFRRDRVAALARPAASRHLCSPGSAQRHGTDPGLAARGRAAQQARRDDNIQWSEGLIPTPASPRDPMVFRIVRNYSVLKSAEHHARADADQVRGRDRARGASIRRRAISPFT